MNQFLLCLSLAVVSGVSLSGVPIIGNSVTGPYQNSGTVGGTPKFVGFTIGAQAVTLDSISVALGAVGLAGGSVTFTLNADNGASNPGALIGTIGSQAIAAGAATAAYTLTPAAPFLLNAGTTYWVGSTPGDVRWDRATPISAPTNGLGTYVGYRFSSGAPSNLFNAIIINGTDVSSAVPEPSGFALAGAGFALFALVRRRAGA